MTIFIIPLDPYSDPNWAKNPGSGSRFKFNVIGSTTLDQLRLFGCFRSWLYLFKMRSFALLKPVLGRGQNRYEKPRVRITSGGQLPSASNQSVNNQYSMLTPNAAGHQKLPLVADKVFLKSSLHFLRGYRYFFNMSSN